MDGTYRKTHLDRSNDEEQVSFSGGSLMKNSDE